MRRYFIFCLALSLHACVSHIFDHPVGLDRPTSINLSAIDGHFEQVRGLAHAFRINVVVPALKPDESSNFSRIKPLYLGVGEVQFRFKSLGVWWRGEDREEPLIVDKTERPLNFVSGQQNLLSAICNINGGRAAEIHTTACQTESVASFSKDKRIGKWTGFNEFGIQQPGSFIFELSSSRLRSINCRGRSFLSLVKRSISDVESLRDIYDANTSDKQHQQGPPRHILLGVQVVLISFLLLLGIKTLDDARGISSSIAKARAKRNGLFIISAACLGVIITLLVLV